MLKITIILLAAYGFATASEAEALSIAAQAAGAKGNIVLSEDIFYKALIQDQNCGSALFGLGKIEQAKGRYQIAVSFYDRCIESDAKPEIKKLAITNAGSIRAASDKALQSTLAEYYELLKQISKRHSDDLTLEEANQRHGALNLSRFGDEFSRIELAFNGTPLASVEIEESMGYKIDKLIDGSSSHTNLANKFEAIPAELKGKAYTQQVSNSTSPLKIKFITAGSVYILANSSWGGYAVEAKSLAKIGKKTTIKPVFNGKEKYEVWIVQGSKGQIVETTNHAVVSSVIRK
jgi:tetratricopeptide (TPR) repeat protein